MRKTAALTLRELLKAKYSWLTSFVNKVSVLLKFSLLSKTVPSCLYSDALSIFHAISKEIWNDSWSRIVRAFYNLCCVSTCPEICIECKKNRRWDSTLWRAGGNRTGRREYILVTNCLGSIGKKIDSPENQSSVNVDFQKFACLMVWLYGIEGRRKVDENSSK